MNKIHFVLFFSLLGCNSLQTRGPQSAASVIMHTEMVPYEIKVHLVPDVQLRAGYAEESSQTPFKGCVIYLQGLGDSILNHEPLFKKITDNGYRVLFFDYMGQGGSTGTMNHTRLSDPLYRNLEIGAQTEFIWKRYSAIPNKLSGQNCSIAKKTAIGWSTGGLASYKLAKEKKVDAVVLIAPGINPKTLVGEAATDPLLMASNKALITERTLTRNKFDGFKNPHIDPINPESPTHVPLFASNLLLTSKLAQRWNIPSEVSGLVFLSGDEDTYVDRNATIKTLARRAPHFSVISYEGALHELDNEIDSVASDLHQRVVSFLNKVNHK